MVKIAKKQYQRPGTIIVKTNLLFSVKVATKSLIDEAHFLQLYCLKVILYFLALKFIDTTKFSSYFNDYKKLWAKKKQAKSQQKCSSEPDELIFFILLKLF